jgi:hypothetical protein
MPGGPPGGGVLRGGGGGGPPMPGGLPTGQPQGGNRGTDKLSGNPPAIFTREQTKGEEFLTQWALYRGVNHNNAIMQNLYQRAMLFLTYHQGKDVTKWVIAISRWLTEQIDVNSILPTNEWLWRRVEHSFRWQYADTLAQEMAQADLKKGLKWTGDVDMYVTKFEQLVRAAGYEIDANLTIDIFTTGLP